MPNILFLSDNNTFKSDILDQIAHHAEGFCVIEDDGIADVVIVDEDIKLLENFLKKDIKAPIILLSSKEIDDTIGAHHIIYKPMNLSDFLDDIKASINVYEKSSEGKLEFNNYILNPSHKEILNLRNNEITKLTEKEVAIIKYLYKNRDKTIGKNDLIQEVWGYSADVYTHTVETHIYRLRQKVEHDDVSAQLIITSDGGYSLKF